MADFKADVSVVIICRDCGEELDCSINDNPISHRTGYLEVSRCECEDDSLKDDGANSRDDEVAELKSRIEELESELESRQYAALERD